MIDRFTGCYRFLSNFYPALVTLDGVTYSSVEHAYQAAKTLDPRQRTMILRAKTSSDAKRLGNRLSIRHDWYYLRLVVMEDLVRQKFTNHQHLRDVLLSTGEQELIERNTWGDRFWGICEGVGENHLGKILMKVRHELRLTPAIDVC